MRARTGWGASVTLLLGALSCAGSGSPESAAVATGGSPADSPSPPGGSSGGRSLATGDGGAAAGGAADGGTANSGGATAGADSGGSGGVEGTGAAGNEAVWQENFPTFTAHTIASFSSGYALVIADIDGDEKRDVVALSSASAGLVWFKNPSWDKYTVTTQATGLIHTAAYDVDGDGDVDLAFASDFSMNDTTSGGTVSWAENPGDPLENQSWELHEIDSIPTSHRLSWADLEGDGTKELIVLPIFGVGSSAPAHDGAVQLSAYLLPSDLSAPWQKQLLDDSHLEVAHGLAVVDYDGDGSDDILTAANDGVDLFRPSMAAAREHLADGAPGQAPDRGSSEIGLGQLGESRFLATIEPWHGTDAVIYTPGSSASEPWTRTQIGSDFEHGHGLVVADFNGDGYEEVLAGGGQGDMAQVIYRYVPSSGIWEKISLDQGSVAVSGMAVSDLNGDGALDVITIGGSPTNNLVWYESH